MVSNCPPTVLFVELITEVLSWLPVKTLMQMKCVCKSWKTLISNDTVFANLHLRRSPRNTHLALVPCWSKQDQEPDCSVVPFPVDRLLHNCQTIIPYDPYYRLKDMDCCKIVGSCNGLICLLDWSFEDKYQNTWLRFWNPATRTLSKNLGYFRNGISESHIFKFTFGYDNLTNTYKVVGFSANQVNVFSLGGDNVWRNIQSFPIVPFGTQARRPSRHPLQNYGVYVSGTINWLVIRNKTDYEWNDITIDQFVIVSLDLGTETYQELLPPRGFVEVPPVEPSVTMLMDCLCFSHRFKGTDFVLWKMMEFGVQESWTQFLKISYYENLQIAYGISDSFDSRLFLFPLYVSESSNTLVLASNQIFYDESQAILYNWRDNRVEKTRFTNHIQWSFLLRIMLKV